MDQYGLDQKKDLELNEASYKITSEIWTICDILRRANKSDLTYVLTVLEIFTEWRENEILWKNYIDKLKLMSEKEVLHTLNNWNYYPHLMSTPDSHDSHQSFLEKSWYDDLNNIIMQPSYSKEPKNASFNIAKVLNLTKRMMRNWISKIRKAS